MRLSRLIPALFILFALNACDESNTSIEDAAQTGGVARFDPAAAQNGDTNALPFPTNLLFSDSEDGTINFSNPDPENPAQVALDALDGFSTVAPITATFSAALGEKSLVGGRTVRVFEVAALPLTQGGVVTGIVAELTPDVDYSVSISTSRPDDPGKPDDAELMITLQRPLKAKTTYLVALLKEIKFTNGTIAVADQTYLLAKSPDPLIDGNEASQTPLLNDEQAAQLEPLRQLVNQQEKVLAGTGIAADDILLSWAFTTQSIADVLKTVRLNAPETPNVAIGPVVTETPGSLASVHCGTLDVPYYLSPPSVDDPTAPLTKFWTGAGGSNLTQFNTTPEQISTEALPLLLAIPKSVKPASGWPVVIFQHGIEGNRANLLNVADTLANADFVSVSIDLPLHGITPTESLYAPNLAEPCKTGERTFDMDFATGSRPGTPDGVDDPTGIHFINLQSLLTSRDNLRQGEADLFVLNKALKTIDIDGGGPDLDSSQTRFLGQSLGSIAGSVFLALEPDVGTAVLAIPGGGIAKLLDGSPTRGPQIAAGLEIGTTGQVRKGFQSHEAFMRAAQTALDSGDPINYGQDLVSGRGVLVFEVVGGNTSSSDQTIPNNVLTGEPPTVAPITVAGLGGTEPLADAAGLTPINATTTGPNLAGIVKFTGGHHNSLLTSSDLGLGDAATAEAVNLEMHAIAANFLISNGENIEISDPSLVRQ